MTYMASIPPQRPEEVPAWIQKELARLAEAFQRAQTQVTLTYLHAAPSRTQAGDVVMADGSDWNPGSGAGAYRRNEANSAWVFLG